MCLTMSGSSNTLHRVSPLQAEWRQLKWRSIISIRSTQGRGEARDKNCREPRRQQQAMTRRGRQAGTTQKL